MGREIHLAESVWQQLLTEHFHWDRELRETGRVFFG